MKLIDAVKKIRGLDNKAIKESEEHWLSIAKPLFSLGKFEKIITRISGIKGSVYYNIDKKALIVMCSDNGVVEEGVTQTGRNMTAVVAENFAKGMTSASIMSQIAGVDVFPVDIGMASDVPDVTNSDIKIAYGTKNMAKEAAMTRTQAISAIECGINKVIELKKNGYNIIATGEMGIGNTTTSSAVISVLLDILPEKVTGKGAGLTAKGLERKIEVIKKAIEINKPDKNDAIDVLAKVGGFDIAAIAGIFIGGALCRIPIIVDGFISAVGAVIAKKIAPLSQGYMIASHISKEPAGGIVLNELGLSPVISADMCLGEGTGAVALFPLIDMAYAVYSKMYTFQNWNGNETYHILE